MPPDASTSPREGTEAGKDRRTWRSLADRGRRSARRPDAGTRRYDDGPASGD